MPALLGMVPMPGGALFSAPLVQRATAGASLGPAWKTAVNYWFRHVLEHWWPLYPVVVLTLSMVTLPVWRFFLLQVPFTLVCVGAGYFFLLRGREAVLEAAATESGPLRLRELAQVLLPVGCVVAAVVVLTPLVRMQCPGMQDTAPRLMAMLLGLGFSLGLVYRWRGRMDRPLFSTFFSVKTLDVVLTLGGVLVFQGLLEQSGAIEAAGREFQALALPATGIVVGLPFLAGWVTGIAIGFAGPAFPLILAMNRAGHGPGEGAVLVLAFASGYVGMMLSPIHLCYVLTRRYFGASYWSATRYILPCTAAVACWAAAVHLLLRRVKW